MKKGEKFAKIKQAVIEFVKEHHNDDREFKAGKIKAEIQKKVGFPVTWHVSDFAAKECNKERSKDNGEFFVRTRTGYYNIKK